jgi:hypothetical protein
MSEDPSVAGVSSGSLTPTPDLSPAPPPAAGRPSSNLSPETGWRRAGCFILLLVALHVVVGPKARLSEWRVDATVNPSFAEATAWRSGRLDLDKRMHDTALIGGRVYNVYPPLFTFISYAALAGRDLNLWVMGRMGIEPPDASDAVSFPTSWLVGLVALPLVAMGFWALGRATGRSAWAALLCFGWIAGTPVIACLATARGGSINHINHLLSQTGLMLIAAALLGRRRLALALVGLIIAVWSRPLTVAFVLPILWAAWRWDATLRQRRLIAAAAALVLAIGAPMTLNGLKFGSPFDTGYAYIYAERTDELAERGRASLFSPSYAKRNAWYMNLEMPGWEVGSFGIRPVLDSHGAGIWFTMPLLLFAIFGVRHWWADRTRRWLMLGSLPVIVGILCYHNTGYVQPGYYRFVLDFLPIWLVVIAPLTVGDVRSRLALGAVAWSALYFNLIT